MLPSDQLISFAEVMSLSRVSAAARSDSRLEFREIQMFLAFACFCPDLRHSNGLEIVPMVASPASDKVSTSGERARKRSHPEISTGGENLTAKSSGWKEKKPRSLKDPVSNDKRDGATSTPDEPAKKNLGKEKAVSNRKSEKQNDHRPRQSERWIH